MQFECQIDARQQNLIIFERDQREIGKQWYNETWYIHGSWNVDLVTHTMHSPYPCANTWRKFLQSLFETSVVRWSIFWTESNSNSNMNSLQKKFVTPCQYYSITVYITDKKHMNQFYRRESRISVGESKLGVWGRKWNINFVTELQSYNHDQWQSMVGIREILSNEINFTLPLFTLHTSIAPSYFTNESTQRTQPTMKTRPSK